MILEKSSADILKDIGQKNVSKTKLSNTLSLLKDIGKISVSERKKMGKGRPQIVYEIEEEYYKTVFLK